jgi:hypothetical protein
MANDRFQTTGSGAERAAWAQKMFNSYKDLNPTSVIYPALKAALIKRLNIAEIFDIYRFENDAKWFFFSEIGFNPLVLGLGPIFKTTGATQIPCLVIYDDVVVNQSNTLIAGNIINDGFIFISCDFEIITLVQISADDARITSAVEDFASKIFAPNTTSFTVGQETVLSFPIDGMLNPKIETIFIADFCPSDLAGKFLAQLGEAYLTKGLIPMVNLELTCTDVTFDPAQLQLIEDIQVYFVSKNKTFTVTNNTPE